MDPQQHNNESVPYKLPEVQADGPELTPKLESPAVDAADEKQLSQAIEMGTNGTPSVSASTNAQIPAIDPVFNPVPLTPPQASTKILVSTDDLHAGDGDLIEKAWVVKAKAIVAKTKDDPYIQNNEIKKVKADYQLKRFNNKLKVENE